MFVTTWPDVADGVTFFIPFIVFELHVVESFALFCRVCNCEFFDSWDVTCFVILLEYSRTPALLVISFSSGPSLGAFSYEFEEPLSDLSSRPDYSKSLYELIETLSYSSSPDRLTSSILSYGEFREPHDRERDLDRERDCDLDLDLDRLDGTLPSSSSF